MTDATIPLQVQILPHGIGLPVPAYQSLQAAGLDLAAAIPAHEPMTLQPGRRELIPTGLSIALPSSFEAQVRPRSGLAAKHGITVLNSPGTIDADYRGEVKVILINLGSEPFRIERGDRIAQLVVAAIARVSITVVPELSETPRSGGGFGSTGVSDR